MLWFSCVARTSPAALAADDVAIVDCTVANMRNEDLFLDETEGKLAVDPAVRVIEDWFVACLGLMATEVLVKEDIVSISESGA